MSIISSVSPAVTSALSALDNERSLIPLLVKDGIDNIGRTTMEYKRGGKGAHHAGRERMIEEFATTAIWIGARPFINKFIINPIMKHVFGLNPDVDIKLLLKEGHSQVHTKLYKDIMSAGLKKQYVLANVARFMIGTFIPVILIGRMIPTINQAITRRKVLEEYHAQKRTNLQTVAKPTDAGSTGSPRHDTANAQTPGASGFTPSVWGASQYAFPMAQNTTTTGFSPNAWGATQYAFPMAGATTAHNPNTPNAFTPPPSPRPGLRFSGSGQFVEKLAHVINTEPYGNIAIDAGITGGRLTKTRNRWDLLETAMREGSIVLFLYYLGDRVKTGLRNWFDNSWKGVTGLTFDSLNWLKGLDQTSKVPRPTREAWLNSMKMLEELPESAAFDYVSQHLDVGTGRFHDHPVLELARIQGHIKVIPEQPNWFARQWRRLTLQPQTVTGPYKLSEAAFLDIGDIKDVMIEAKPRAGFWQRQFRSAESLATYEADLLKTQPIKPGLVKQLLSATQAEGSVAWEKGMMNVLKRTGRYKGIAMVAGYVVSTGFVAVVTPLVSHWLTKKLSGRADFPGIRH